MSLVAGYSSSDDEEGPSKHAQDAFGLSSIPATKKFRVDEPSSSLTITAAPDVLSEVSEVEHCSLLLTLYTSTYIQDPLKQTSLITRPTDTRMNVNIPYADMMLPLQGPENPFGDRNRFLNQNALAGHVEEQSMTEHAFRQQHLTHSILGYSANPSVDPNAPAILGSVEKAQANGFATIDSLKASKASKKELKRKRNAMGDLEVVDGEGAYEGPWASWVDEEAQDTLPEGVEDEAEESEPEEMVQTRKAKPKRGAPGLESSVFHGKSMTDYQGRTYMSPPFSEAPQLQSEAGSQETFIPKVCIHTWTGHTQGVSVIRLFPNTGHLLLSGSMDTKIKVSHMARIQRVLYDMILVALGRLHARKLSTDIPWAYETCERCYVL